MKFSYLDAASEWFITESVAQMAASIDAFEAFCRTLGYYVGMPVVPDDPPPKPSRVGARGELISSRRKFLVLAYIQPADEYEITFDDEVRAHAQTQPTHRIGVANLEGSARWTS